MPSAPMFSSQPLASGVHALQPTRQDLIAGALTGQTAGLIMSVVMMVIFPLFLDHSPLFPVQVIGSVLLGDSALVGLNVAGVAAGLFLHFGVASVFWGVAYAVCFKALNANGPVNVWALGLAMGLLSQIVDVHVVLPFLYSHVHGHNIWAENVPSGWSIAAHVVFGLSMGLYGRIRPYVR